MVRGGGKSISSKKLEYFKDASGGVWLRELAFYSIPGLGEKRRAGSFVPFFLFVDTQAPKYKPEIPEHKNCESTFLSEAHNSFP
jgi:hypothetical protein